jgi:tripartite-type tricarboxylate transporter receptor subunit TctC
MLLVLRPMVTLFWQVRLHSCVNPAFNPTTAGYQPEKDFSPVVIGATQPMVIVVNQSLGIKNFHQLKEIAAKEKLSFASAGAGTQPHLACERIFNGLWKLNIPHIPYKGISPGNYRPSRW